MEHRPAGPDGRALRAAAAAGWAGAALIGGSIAGLSVTEYEFMRGLGWRPLEAPTFDWPSGLALGPYGALMTAAFIGSGALFCGFAAGLRRALGPALGPRLLLASGVALMLLASPTDPTLRSTPATLAGQLHDAAFALLGLTFVPAMLALAASFWRAPAWRAFALPSLLAALSAGPAFLLKGWLFYLFLAAALAWVAGVSARLWQLAEAS